MYLSWVQISLKKHVIPRSTTYAYILRNYLPLRPRILSLFLYLSVHVYLYINIYATFCFRFYIRWPDIYWYVLYSINWGTNVVVQRTMTMTMTTTIWTAGHRIKDLAKEKRRRATGRACGGVPRCFCSQLLIGVPRPELRRERLPTLRRQVIRDLIKLQSRATKRHQPGGRVSRY